MSSVAYARFVEGIGLDAELRRLGEALGDVGRRCEELRSRIYLVLDLWYAIGTEYPWGLVGFLAFYLSLYLIRCPVLRALERRPE